MLHLLLRSSERLYQRHCSSHIDSAHMGAATGKEETEASGCFIPALRDQFASPSSSWCSPRIAGNQASSTEKITLSEENGKHSPWSCLLRAHRLLWEDGFPGERTGWNRGKFQATKGCLEESMWGCVLAWQGVGTTALRSPRRAGKGERPCHSCYQQQ